MSHSQLQYEDGKVFATFTPGIIGQYAAAGSAVDACIPNANKLHLVQPSAPEQNVTMAGPAVPTVTPTTTVIPHEMAVRAVAPSPEILEAANGLGEAVHHKDNQVKAGHHHASGAQPSKGHSVV